MNDLADIYTLKLVKYVSKKRGSYLQWAVTSEEYGNAYKHNL